MSKLYVVKFKYYPCINPLTTADFTCFFPSIKSRNRTSTLKC